jgi:hypothetical protein
MRIKFGRSSFELRFFIAGKRKRFLCAPEFYPLFSLQVNPSPAVE